MITIEYDDNVLDVINKFSRELKKYGFHIEDVSQEGVEWCDFEIVQDYSLPDIHHPDCNCRECR